MTARVWRALVLAAAAATSIAAAVAPTVATSSCVTTSPGSSSCTSTRESLLAGEGSAVLLVLAVPVLVSLWPLLLGTHRATVLAAAALTLAMLVALMSIGILYLPTVALAWVAVASSTRPLDTAPHRSPAEQPTPAGGRRGRRRGAHSAPRSDP